MRKFIIFVFAFAMITALAACGADEDKPLGTVEINAEKTPEISEKNEEKSVAVIEAKNCFYNAGFVELVAGAEEASEYIFTEEHSETVEWCVYVLDQAFDDGFRYIKQVAEPVLVGDGTIFIDEGQYVYIYCSANEFTTGVADENAKLNVTVK